MRWSCRVQIALRVDALGPLIVAETRTTYVNVQRHVTILPPVAEQAQQCVAERLTEIAIEVGIDQRIQCRVEVANPEEYGDHNVRHLTPVAGHGERVPAKDIETYKNSRCINKFQAFKALNETL